MGRCGRLGPAPVLALVLPREPRFALGFDFGFVFVFGFEFRFGFGSGFRFGLQ